jgi:hypothetical protein
VGWLSDPLVWILLLPSLAASGVLVQMVLGLFTCCGTFRFRGRAVHLRWWTIPAGLGVSALCWGALAAYLMIGTRS